VKFHYDELALAQQYEGASHFEALTEDQTRRIMERGRALYHWFKDHLALHYAISATVLVILFGSDYWIQTRLPTWWLAPNETNTTTAIVIAAIVAGSLHSWLLYSLAVFSMHEGAAHKLVFPPQGPITRVMHGLSTQLCRISASEPNYYSSHHMAHHAKFGTDGDGEFLNFVRTKRYVITFIPYAVEFDYSDFIIHRPLGITLGRLASAPWAIGYNGLYAWFAWNHFGGLYTVLTYLVLMPHVGFFLDRVRQFTEHNLMPLENHNGSRSWGLGFWGLLVGGGPWGSPCHWEHHLVPSLPWYQQAVLHRDLVKMLTPVQREQFLITPVVGFPKLWWRLMRETRQFATRARAASGASRV
jgi:hypothetical protein